MNYVSCISFSDVTAILSMREGPHVQHACFFGRVVSIVLSLSWRAKQAYSVWGAGLRFAVSICKGRQRQHNTKRSASAGACKKTGPASGKELCPLASIILNPPNDRSRDCSECLRQWPQVEWHIRPGLPKRKQDRAWIARQTKASIPGPASGGLKLLQPLLGPECQGGSSRQ